MFFLQPWYAFFAYLLKYKENCGFLEKVIIFECEKLNIENINRVVVIAVIENYVAKIQQTEVFFRKNEN